MSHCFPFYFHFHFASEPVSSAVVSPMDFRGRHRQRSRWRRPSDAAQQTIHFFRGFRFGISTSLRFFFFYISFFYFFFGWSPLFAFLLSLFFLLSSFHFFVCVCVRASLLLPLLLGCRPTSHFPLRGFSKKTPRRLWQSRHVRPHPSLTPTLLFDDSFDDTSTRAAVQQQQQRSSNSSSSSRSSRSNK